MKESLMLLLNLFSLQINQEPYALNQTVLINLAWLALAVTPQSGISLLLGSIFITPYQNWTKNNFCQTELIQPNKHTA